MIYDLHSHTIHSDGSLTTEELLSRAIENDVDVLSITDHDTIDAYRAMPRVPQRIQLVPGIEFSTQWEHIGIHVLGLNIDPGSTAIAEGVRFQSKARIDRARQIAERLEKRGIQGAFDGAAKLSANDYIGRPHFARHLVETGRARDMQDAFKRYMGDGKAGDVQQHWAGLAQIIEWIKGANGIALLAHPLKYKLTRTRLKRLLSCFVEAGGQGMEVISGQQTAQQTTALARLCAELNLLASCGSDFHMPDRRWAELGSFARLPENVTPVWTRFKT